VWVRAPATAQRQLFFASLDGLAGGTEVIYTATGDGSVVGVNARTGDPLWRVPLFKAGINASVLVHRDERLIAVFGTPYELGQMVGLKLPRVAPTNAADGPIVLRRTISNCGTTRSRPRPAPHSRR